MSIMDGVIHHRTAWSPNTITLQPQVLYLPVLMCSVVPRDFLISLLKKYAYACPGYDQPIHSTLFVVHKKPTEIKDIDR